MYHHISAINQSTTEWTLKLRISRMWDSVIADGVIQLHNLIPLDSQNVGIHATISPELWNQFSDLLREGVIYTITNVQVHQAVALLRPVRNDQLISFFNKTTVGVISEDDSTIPAHKFYITQLPTLFEQIQQLSDANLPEYSSDLIGVVEDLQPIQFYDHLDGVIGVVKFNLSDGREKCRVILFGMPAVATDALYENGIESPLIAILASTRISVWRGNIICVNFPSTHIYVNLSNTDVFNLRARLLGDV